MEKEKYKLAKKFLEDSGIGVDQKNLHLFVSDLDFYEKVNKRWESTSKEKKEQDSVETKYGEVPESLAQFEVAYFSGVDIFQDIIDNKFDHNELLTTEDTNVLLGAIEHYFEYDDFQD